MHVHKHQKLLDPSTQVEYQLIELAVEHTVVVAEMNRQSPRLKDQYSVYVFVNRDAWPKRDWANVHKRLKKAFGEAVYVGSRVSGFNCIVADSSRLYSVHEIVCGLFA